MIHDTQFDSTAERLRALLGAGALPEQATARARDLLARLEAPVRVALIGPEAGGRAEAIATILGEPAVAGLPEVPDRATLEIAWGPVPRTEAQLACGRRIEVDDPADALQAQDTVLVTLERPLSALRRMRLVDLVVEPAVEDLQAALGWAARRADVVVWWSREFGAAENAAWRAAPPHLHDHGFLVVREAGDATPQGRPGGDFLKTIVAGPGDAEAGLRRLAAELTRHVDFGRQADNDSALLFLRKHEARSRPAAPAPIVAPAPAPAARVAPGSAGPAWPLPAARAPGGARQAQAPPEGAGADARQTPGRAGEPPAGKATAPPPAPETPPAEAEAERGGAAARAFCREAAAHIRARARHLRGTDPAAGGRAAPRVTRHCAETIRRLVERIDDAAEADAVELEGLATLLTAAEERLVLLEAEGAGAAEGDALRLMQQLRRSFEAGATP
jgi:hypothetical protein